MESYVAAYATLGFERCDDGLPVVGVEKIAVFVDGQGKPTHAARQLSNGEWTSKLGKSFDISHGTPDGVAGRAYGTVSLFLSRGEPSR